MAHVFSGVMQQGGATLSLEVDEVGPMGNDDMAYERSHFTFFKKDKSVMMKGK